MGVASEVVVGGGTRREDCGGSGKLVVGVGG